MIDMKRRRALGSDVAEYIETLPYELDSDGVGLWVIVPAGRSFGFEGDDLAEFVGLCILRLLDVGGVAVRHADHGPRRWVQQTHYGTSKTEIAAAIVAEWQLHGGGNPQWGSLWFVTRRVLEVSPFTV